MRRLEQLHDETESSTYLWPGVNLFCQVVKQIKIKQRRPRRSKEMLVVYIQATFCSGDDLTDADFLHSV